MTIWLILITILGPVVGAVLVWLAGDKRPQIQNGLAVLFSLNLRRGRHRFTA
ncbi:MAG: hypothetical protein ACK2U0_21635 [Candidatus Promineifilaceae bacterium]